MAASEKCTVSLPAAPASDVDTLVETGACALATEVMGADLGALQGRDAAVEHWLRNDVVPVYDAMQADPSRGISVDEVMAALNAHHTARRTKTGRGA